MLHRSAENNCTELLKAKNQLALDLERLLSHKEVSGFVLSFVFQQIICLFAIRLQLLHSTVYLGRLLCEISPHCRTSLGICSHKLQK